MKDERILTLHPEGKKGVSIQRSKYDPVARLVATELGVAACGHLVWTAMTHRRN